MSLYSRFPGTSVLIFTVMYILIVFCSWWWSFSFCFPQGSRVCILRSAQANYECLQVQFVELLSLRCSSERSLKLEVYLINIANNVWLFLSVLISSVFPLSEWSLLFLTCCWRSALQPTWGWCIWLSRWVATFIQYFAASFTPATSGNCYFYVLVWIPKFLI